MNPEIISTGNFKRLTRHTLMLMLTLAAAMLLLAAGCQQAQRTVTKAEAEADVVSQMRADLADARLKVDAHCGAGTAEAAAAEEAREALQSALEQYQQAAALVNEERLRKSEAMDPQASLPQKIDQAQRTIQQKNDRAQARENGQAGSLGPMMNVWFHVAEQSEFIKLETRKVMDSIPDRLDRIASQPGVTPAHLTQSYTLAREMDDNAQRVDQLYRDVYDASRQGDSDRTRDAFLMLNAVFDRLDAQAQQMDLLLVQIEFDEVIRPLDAAIDEAQKAFDQKKQQMNDALTDAAGALQAARAKAVGCAGSDTTEDGTPLFPSTPVDWNSAFWDIHSP